jgi:LDH2 family malate/lactate/ureidoglycolate dehydrogenase
MTTTGSPARYPAAGLIAFGRGLLESAGMPADRAADVADVLVEADLLGHDTHGLNLLPIYLREIEAGSMTLTGDPLTLSDRGAAITWDGRRLPGPWLVLRAYELAAQRARLHGTGTVVIRRSHHVACLAAYLERAAAQGLVLLIYSSGPSNRTVAPFGGVTPVYTPNPLAAGFPAGDQPVMLDVSTSITTNNLMARLNREGRRLEHPWLIDAQGAPSTDPSVVFADPPGSILPIGGLDHGHKGYALSLLVEALTGGLSGHGRADAPERPGREDRRLVHRVPDHRRRGRRLPESQEERGQGHRRHLRHRRRLQEVLPRRNRHPERVAPILKKEMDDCKAAGIEYIELPVAFDALTVVMNPKNAFLKQITVEPN